MGQYILLKEMEFTSSIYKTVKLVEEAYNFVKDVVANGGEVIFVGTKTSSRSNRNRSSKMWNALC